MNLIEHDKLSLLKELNENFSSAVLPVSIFIGCESVLGFLGNILVLYVYAFKYKRGNFRTYILFLGAIGLISCLTAMPAEIVTLQHWYNNQYIYLCEAKTFFIMFITLAETMCLFLICIDRYRKICKHLQWQVQKKIAHVCCLLIVTVSVIVAIVCPDVWETRSFEVVYKNTNVTMTGCGSNHIHHHVIYFSTIGTMVMVLSVAMFIMYILIAAKLRLEQKKHRFHSMVNLSLSQHSISAAVTSCIQEDRCVAECTDVSTGGTTESLAFNKILLAKYSKTERRVKQNDVSLLICPTVPAQMLTKQCVSDSTSNIEISATSEPESEPLGETHVEVGHITCVSNSPRGCIRKQQRAQPRLTTRAYRNTRMMMILTYSFIMTTIIYFSLMSFFENIQQFVHNLPDGGKATFLFFFHIHFIQYVINPFVYGVVDKRFQTIVKTICVSTVRKMHLADEV